MKTSTFDRDLFITQKAERLIGDAVKITCWDPVHEPGKWSSQGYFRGIYAVDEGQILRKKIKMKFWFEVTYDYAW